MIQHDWLLENLANPDLDIFELTSLGELSTDNTQFLSKEDYLKSNFVKEKFTDSEGNFQDKLFESFYNEVSEKWQNFQEDDYKTGLELSEFDTAVRPSSRVKDYNFYLGSDVDELGRPNNPNRVKKGIEGFRTISERTRSEAEIAQSSRIFDPETDEYLDVTPNDYSLTNNPTKWVTDILLGQPLALASYDEDTVDKYGIEHKKGEFKYNDFGTYYYEKLNGRSPIGKQILSIGDLITPETSMLNNIDFFDSDGLKKSATGVIAKNVALVAPLFMGPGVATLYTTAIIAKELTRSLPMLASWVTIWDDDYETPQWIQSAAAHADKMSSGVSVNSRENVFTLENVANLISDVALQFSQQKKIAQALNYFTVNPKNELKKAKVLAKKLYDSKKGDPRLSRMIAAEGGDWEASQLGQSAIRKYTEPIIAKMRAKQQHGANLALAYMALVSNYDVYNTMIEKGATNQEAALVSAASTIGMFAVDKYLGLDKLFFEELSPGTAKALRSIIGNEIKEVTSKFYTEGSKLTAKQWFKEGFSLGKTLIKNTKNKIKNQDLGIFGKALGEGFEEVGEEFVTDLSKQLYDYGVFNTMLGYDKTIKTAGAWENAVERYSMSLLGGFIGGGLYGVQGYKYNRSLDWDMVDAIREGHGDALRSIVKQRIKDGTVHNTKISGLNYTQSEGKTTWLSTTDKSESQNDIAGQKILDKINQIEAIIIGNNANKSDDQLFENMVLQDARFMAYRNASHFTGYYDEYKKRLNTLLQVETTYINALKSPTGNPNDDTTETDSEKRNKSPEEEVKKQENIAQLKANRDQAKLEFDKFLSGDRSLEYTRKLSFALDPILNSVFLDLDIHKFLESKGTTLAQFKEKDFNTQVEIFQEYQDHYKNTMVKGLDAAFNTYLTVEKTLQAPLLQQQEFEQVYKNFYNVVQNLFKNENTNIGEFVRSNPFYNWDTPIIKEDGQVETDEEFKNRDNLDIAGFISRIQQIKNINLQTWNNYLQQFEEALTQVDFNVDSNTARQIQQLIQYRNKDVLKQIALYPYIKEDSVFRNQNYYLKTVLDLNEDLSNLDQIRENLQKMYYTKVLQDVQDFQNKFNQNSFAFITDRYISPTSKAIKTIRERLQLDNQEESLYKFNQLVEKYESQDKLVDEFNGEELDLEKAKKILESYKKELSSFIQELPEVYTIIEKDGQVQKKSVLDIIENIINKNYPGENEESFATSKFTIQNFLEMLNDPTSILFQKLSEYSEELPIQLNQYFNGLKKDNTPNIIFPFGRDSKVGILFQSSSAEGFDGATMQLQKKTVLDYLHQIIAEYKQHPLFIFNQKLKTAQKSPIAEVFNTINKTISENKNDVVNINYILDQVYKDYISASDISKFEANNTQLDQLKNAENILNLVWGYVYSISNPVQEGNYFGHTSQINQFAKDNKSKLEKEWELLPEISNDFGALLRQEVENLQKEIIMWQQISENNSMNKLRRLVEVEDVYNKLKDDLFKKLGATLTTDDKQYQTTQGINDSPATNLKDLALKEQQFYINFVKAFNDSGLTLEQFFDKSDFWNTLFGDSREMIDQKTARLVPNMDKLTTYDQAILTLMYLAEDPATYYKNLELFIKDNQNIAPLTVQQTGARIAQVAHSKTFKEGFKALAKHLDINNLSLLLNTVHINGTAGAGKTAVLLKAVRQRFHDEKALVIAPTTQQAVNLQNSLNENTSYTVENGSKSNIFELILSNYGKLQKDYDDAVTQINQYLSNKNNLSGNTLNLEKFKELDYEYFTVDLQVAGNFPNAVFKLKDNIVFNKDFDQSLIFVDEAAHLNPLQLALLDKLAERNGGTLYVANDNTQSGYENGLAFRNLNTNSIFCVRTPKLQESIRSSNIQKQANNAKLEAIIDTADLLQGNYEALQQYLDNLANTLKTLNLRAYTKDDINGDLFNADIDEVISKLPKNAVVGFIGDPESEIYNKLKSAGFDVKGPFSVDVVPNRSHMQGQEFDYVVVDRMELPELDQFKSIHALKFLRKFNTLSTRSKIATIFLDDFTPYFGKNQIDSLKSDGFNIVPQIEEFRKSYLERLKQLNLEEAAIKLNDKIVKKDDVEKIDEEEYTVNSPVLDERPEYSPDIPEEQLKEITQNEADETKTIIDEKPEEPNDVKITDKSIRLLIEANLTAPNIGLNITNVDEENKPLKYNRWVTSGEPQNGETRRNADALYFEGSFTSLQDKKQIQSDLSSIQSAVIYGSNPSGELLTFDNWGACWQNRKLYVEFRPATEKDFFGVGTGLKPTFININGKKWVISVVCKLEGLRKTAVSNSFDAIFDISFLNDPNTLLNKNKQDEIRNNLKNKLAKGTISADRKTEVESFCNNLGIIAQQWSDFVKTVTTENSEGVTIEMPNYYSHKTTSLHKSKYVKRLGGNISIQDFENNNFILQENEDGTYTEVLPENWDNFEDVDNRKVVSPVYIFGAKSDELIDKVDPSVIGKAVVFVSANTNLDPEKLAEMWLKQKQNPSEHTPEVRAVILGNHGVSFKEFLTHRLQQQLESGKFHRMDVLGARMFQSLWNFRAALINFNNALGNWTKTVNYTDDQLELITYAEYKIFTELDSWKDVSQSILEEDTSKIQSTLDKVQEILNTFNEENKSNITVQDINNLVFFNFEVCKNIPMFRLGYDTTRKQAGGYVRNFKVSNSDVYSKHYVNLFAINKKYATKYQELLNVLFGQLTSNEVPESLTKANFDFNTIGLTVAKPNGEAFKPYEYIGDDGRKLTGMLKTTSEGLKITEKTEDGKTVEYQTTNEQLFSFIPKILSKLANQIKIYQRTKNYKDDLLTVSTIDKNNVTGEVNMLISQFFGENLLENTTNDDSFYNLLNLAFHGTVGSIEYQKGTETTKGEARSPYMEDAFAKYGFFVDPELLIREDYKTININGKNGEKWTLLRCGTNKIFFDVDVEVRPGGFQLDLNSLMEQYEKRKNLDIDQQETQETQESQQEAQKDQQIEIIETITAEQLAESYIGGNSIAEDNIAILNKFINDLVKKAGGNFEVEITNNKNSEVRIVGKPEQIFKLKKDSFTGRFIINGIKKYINSQQSQSNTGQLNIVQQLSQEFIEIKEFLVQIKELSETQQTAIESLNTDKDIKSYLKMEENKVIKKELMLLIKDKMAKDSTKKDRLLELNKIINTQC